MTRGLPLRASRLPDCGRPSRRDVTAHPTRLPHQPPMRHDVRGRRRRIHSLLFPKPSASLSALRDVRDFPTVTPTDMTTEWWQRGSIDGVPALLQPVAHMVLQIGESAHSLVDGLSESQWNARPAGVASIAFHVRHMTGVLDRLFTYARGQGLSESQFGALRNEDALVSNDDVPMLIATLDAQVQSALTELRSIDPAILGDHRVIGRAQLPSTVIGCLVHGAEHGMRHVGQLSVTARVVRSLLRP